MGVLLFIYFFVCGSCALFSLLAKPALFLTAFGDSLIPQVAQRVKNPPADAGEVGLIPGSGKTLEEGMTTHSSVLAWRIPWTEGPGGCCP